MGWQDREYYRPQAEGVGSGTRFALPPPATRTLLVIHLAGFLIVQAMRFDVGGRATAVFPLAGATSHPAAILLHPVAGRGALSADLLGLVFIAAVLWSLVAHVETRLGAARTLAAYFAAVLAAGVAYFGLARVLPAMATAPLTTPAGALTAFCLLAWLRLREECVLVVGHPVSTGTMAAILAAVIVIFPLVAHGPGAGVWLAAVACGMLAGTAAGGLSLQARPLHGLRRLRRVRRPPPVPDIDDILDKIRRFGMDSLTPDEQRRLRKASEALRRRGR